MFALARRIDPVTTSPIVVNAGHVLFTAVADEWVDEPTSIWDDGRPLICYSHAALCGMVAYGMVTGKSVEVRAHILESSVERLRVFLCHSSGDKLAVRELYRVLRAHGIQPWLDDECLLPGQDWNLEIRKAVRTSHIVVVCMSPGSVNKSGYVQKEIKYALDVAEEQPEGTIFIIPVKLEPCLPPERLRNWQWVSLYESHGLDKLLKALQVRASSLGLTSVTIR